MKQTFSEAQYPADIKNMFTLEYQKNRVNVYGYENKKV